jgi:hypothetical protein
MGKNNRQKLTGESFDALPDSEKQKIFDSLSHMSTKELLQEFKPLNKSERSKWHQIKKKMGRPKIGKGTTNISVSVERDLLKQADQFAKKHGLSRSELVSKSVRALINSAA